MLYGQNGLDAHDTNWDRTAMQLKKKIISKCKCAQVMIYLGRFEMTCVRVPACAIPEVMWAVHETNNPDTPILLRYCECSSPDTLTSPTMQMLSSPRPEGLPPVGPTKVAMLTLNAAMGIAASERAEAARLGYRGRPDDGGMSPAVGVNAEEGELRAPAALEMAPSRDPPDCLSAAVLYDLASDRMEHFGWEKLAKSVPEFVPFARKHARVLSRLEVACWTLHKTLSGDLPPGVDFKACLDGVCCGMSSLPNKRLRHGRFYKCGYTETSTAEVVAELANGDLYGSAHALSEFSARMCKDGVELRCISMPLAVVDDVLERLTRGDGVPRGEFSITLPPGRVVLTASADVISTFISGVPARVLAAERGATSHCPMDLIVSGFIDNGVSPINSIQAAMAMKKLIARDEPTKPVAVPGHGKSKKRGRPVAPPPPTATTTMEDDCEEGGETPRQRKKADDGCASAIARSQATGWVNWTPSSTAAFYRDLPRLLDSLFSRNISAALVALGAVWEMPPEALIEDATITARERRNRGEGDEDSPPAGIYLMPVIDDGADARYARSTMLEISDGSSSVACHGNLLSGILAYLLPERLHELDHRLADQLEPEIERFCALEDSDGGGIPGEQTDEQILGRCSEQTYGALRLAFMRHRQSDAYNAGGPLSLGDPEALEQFYLFCHDPSAPLQVRRALFCCVTVLINQVAGVYGAKFPIALRRPWSHDTCEEHRPAASPSSSSPSPSEAGTGDQDPDQLSPEPDSTAVFRAVVEALVISGCQRVVKSDGGADPKALLECKGRYGYGLLSSLNIPPSRPTRRIPSAPSTDSLEPLEESQPRPAPGGTIMPEHSATLQIPFLDTCERVLAFFGPDSGRTRLMGQPCVSLSTPYARSSCLDENEVTTPIGTRLGSVGSDSAPPRIAGAFCGRFTPTKLDGQICAWCLFPETSPDGKQKRPLVQNPCARCAIKPADEETIHYHHYHKDCLRVLGAISTIATPTCPACMTPFEAAGVDGTAAVPDLVFTNTAYSTSVSREPAVSCRDLLPMPPVKWQSTQADMPCSVCGTVRHVFAWTFISTPFGTHRFDFDTEACASAFDSSIDSQVCWTPRASLYPLYTTSPTPWRRPFFRLAASDSEMRV
jgi:hypothetical protein